MTDPTPVQREATAEATIDVEWEGMTLSIPTDADEWDVDAIEAFERGQAISLLRAMFTSAVYDQMKVTFQRNHGRTLKLKDLTGLMDAMATAAGFDNAGE